MTLEGGLVRAGLGGVAILGLVAAAAFLSRHRSAAVRRMLWSSAFVALLAVAVGAWAVPKIGVTVPSVIAARALPAGAFSEPDSDVLPRFPVGGSAAGGGEGRRVEPRLGTAHLPGRRSLFLFALWILVALLLALRTLREIRAAARLKSSARPIADWRLSAVGAGSVLEHAGTTVPLTVGLLRPTIILPAASWRAWSDECLRAVLLHELAHARRYDPLFDALAKLAVALHWANPLAHHALARLRDEREVAADDEVIAAGVRPSSYARALLAVARSLAPLRLAGASMAPGGRLSIRQRIEHVLAPKHARGASRRLAVVGATLLASVTTMIACVRLDDAPRGNARSGPEAVSSGAATSAGADQPSLEQQIAARVASLEGQSALAPGALVVGILRDGKKQVFGFGNVSEADRRAPDGETVFEVGSITELFTGLLFAQLIEEGRVAPETPVRALVPDTVRMTPSGSREMTLLDLTSHTSGLPPLPGNFVEQDRRTVELSYPPSLLYAALEAPQAAPGVFRYSFFGAGLLGHLLALHEHASYRDLIHQRVLAPLGLASTDFFGSSERLRARMATGHDPDGIVPHRFDEPVLGACCAIRTTADDLLELARVTIDPDGTPFARALRRMQEPQSAYRANEYMGIGWHLRDAALFKRGGGRGFASYILVLPTRKEAIVVLAGSESIDARKLTMEIAHAMGS